MSAKRLPPDLGASFDASKGARYEDISTSVNLTARAQLDNANQHQLAIDAHQARWTRERDKLAFAGDLYPDFDLGSRGHRNLLSAYEERRTLWHKQADQIDNSFAIKRDHIRKTGKTLSSEFEIHQGEMQNHNNNVPSSDRGFIASEPAREMAQAR